jgi:hypothetical protein
MIPVELTADLGELRETLVRYGELSGKSEADIIAKQSDKLGRTLRANLKELMPAKGSVRAEMLQRLKDGGGVHVRQAVYNALQGRKGLSQDVETQQYRFGQKATATVSVGGKRLNYQALAVKAELGLRESGRGYMSYSTPRNRSYAEEVSIGTQHDRYGRLLSFLKLDLRTNAETKYAQFSWPSDSPALEGLDAAQQLAMIDAAIRFVNADIMDYVNRKLEETKREAGL